MDGQAQLERKLSIGRKGRLVQVEMQIDVAAAGDDPTLQRRAVDQQPDEPRPRMAHVHIGRLPHDRPRVRGHKRYVEHQRVSNSRRNVPSIHQETPKPLKCGEGTPVCKMLLDLQSALRRIAERRIDLKIIHAVGMYPVALLSSDTYLSFT